MDVHQVFSRILFRKLGKLLLLLISYYFGQLIEATVFYLQYQNLEYYKTDMKTNSSFSALKVNDNSFMSLPDENRQTSLFSQSKVPSDNQEIKGEKFDQAKMQQQSYCIRELVNVQNIFQMSFQTAKISKKVLGFGSNQKSQLHNALKLLQMLEQQGSVMDTSKGFKLSFLNPENKIISAYKVASSIIKVIIDLNPQAFRLKNTQTDLYQLELESAQDLEKLAMEITLKWRVRASGCYISLSTNQGSYIPPCNQYMEILFGIIEYVTKKEGLSPNIIGLDANNYHLLSLFSNNTVLKAIKQLNPTGYISKYIQGMTRILEFPTILKPAAYTPLQKYVIDVKMHEYMEEMKKKISKQRTMLLQKSFQMVKLNKVKEQIGMLQQKGIEILTLMKGAED